MSGSSSGVGPGPDGGPCPTGLQCNVSCSNGPTTTISGKVYDPAGKNPLYGVTVFVPATPLQPLPKGVPTGADACDCAALFRSGMVVSTRTAADGTFSLQNAPVGSAVPLVVQVGKWRRQFSVNVTACMDNPQPDKSLTLPSTVSQSGDSMPDIAVSTGSADTLECFFHRVGLPVTEYVAGTGTTGHVHLFSGGDPGGTGSDGRPENPTMAGTPGSSTTLWDTAAHLMPYDVTFLSCEGGETYAANPQVLEQYVNAGGRVYAAHFHYAWFSGPLTSGQSYSAPADWGSNLATWSAAGSGLGTQSNDKIVQTLNSPSALPFAKGQALFQWLGVVGALGVDGAPPMELPVFTPRYNAAVGTSDAPSQPWLTDDGNGDAMLFTFDTPVNAPPAPDGGAPAYCGRVAYGDVHAAGVMADTLPPPNGCASSDLSPQEKALEFMLFDLSSCVIPDSVAP